MPPHASKSKATRSPRGSRDREKDKCSGGDGRREGEQKDKSADALVPPWFTMLGAPPLRSPDVVSWTGYGDEKGIKEVCSSLFLYLILFRSFFCRQITVHRMAPPTACCSSVLPLQ